MKTLADPSRFCTQKWGFTIRRGSRAFTLMEIMTVIVIIGLITAFALPNYVKAVKKADERNARANLMGIRSAVEFYRTNYGTDIPPMGNLNNVNTVLHLSLIDPKMTNYSCTSAGNSCSATHPDGWTLHFHLSGAHNTDGSIHCTTATCPSCPQNPGSCD